jgi:hypothetical protein
VPAGSAARRRAISPGVVHGWHSSAAIPSDLRVRREQILRPEDAVRWIAGALSPGTGDVPAVLVLQPASHQL